MDHMIGTKNVFHGSLYYYKVVWLQLMNNNSGPLGANRTANVPVRAPRISLDSTLRPNLPKQCRPDRVIWPGTITPHPVNNIVDNKIAQL